MGWLYSVVKGIFAGLAQGVLALFGMSDAQKLGRAQIENQSLAADLKEKTHEAEVFEAPDRPESAVIDDMLRHAGK